jgi:hypothetical protein
VGHTVTSYMYTTPPPDIIRSGRCMSWETFLGVVAAEELHNGRLRIWGLLLFQLALPDTDEEAASNN